MPELPDVAAYLAALDERIRDRTLLRVRVKAPFLLRTVDPPLASAQGRTVRDVRRIGKRIALGLDGELWLVVHLMIAGRLHWREPGATLGGRNALAAFDFEHGSLVLTEAGTKSRASLHVVAGEAALHDLDPGGIEPLTSDVASFRAALRAEDRTLKRALTDPRTIAGIGNAYSDEILHAARLSPIARTGRLTDDQWQRLHAATLATIERWTARFIREARGGFPEKVTAFRPDMAVHGRFGKPCPDCGAPVQRIRYADNETNYCARCQNGGRLLSDRSLARLLKTEWPRTLEELETLRRR